ncbi:MAG: alpha/beta hydrolase domain-containing protein [Methylocystis sp.]|uniref:alpha/beta hydrolase domain-containing protein n=1 Tax=Methylocystis sp. TaxID=1911079 RepID=UPI003DA407D7
MRKRIIWLCAAPAALAPASAEVVSFQEKDGLARASLMIDGKPYALDLRLMRPGTSAPNAALLVDAAPDDGLAAFAVARGMTVAAVDLQKLPAPARATALTDLSPRLRVAAGAKRLLGRGRGESGAALAAAAAFDGLLLQDAPEAAKTRRVIETWGADAYWRAPPRPATDPETETRRSYFLAGTAEAATAANCAAPVSERSGAPALRALLVVLDDWTKGVKPPASRVPAEADLVAAETLRWPKTPGWPSPPPGERKVPRIDADGNETSGLRLPDQALPIATFTGFNARKDSKGPPCAAGAAIPFSPTKAEREKSGDPRLSLTERYGSRAYFVATMRVVADKLVRERLLLKEDADAYVAAARQAPF